VKSQSQLITACRLTGLQKMYVKLAGLLRECMAKESSRYAIDGVGIGEGWLAATDGRRLAIVKTKHTLAPGVYVLTKENLLIPRIVVGNFPKWQGLLMKTGRRRLCYKGGMDTSCIGAIVYVINHTADTAIGLNLFLKPAAVLASLGLEVSVYYDMKANGDAAFEIHGKRGDDEIIYVQMPISKKDILSTE